MKEPAKIWKQCTARKTLTDYSTVPPTVKEWVESLSTYDEEEDVMREKQFNENGILLTEYLHYNNEMRLIDYDESGNKTSERIVQYTENENGDTIENSTDLDGNLSEEKLEYDDKGRVIRKIFIENGIEDSYLEFEYDNQNRVIFTRDFEKGKLAFYEKDIYVSASESICLRYNALGQLTLRTEYKKLKDKNTYINSYYADDGKLLRRNEEDRNSEDEVLEQRFYDGNENLTYQIVFGENDEYGFRKELVEYEYEQNILIKRVITQYQYEY